jgi:hypothetical protein
MIGSSSTSNNTNFASLYGTNNTFIGWQMVENYWAEPLTYGTALGSLQEEMSIQTSYNSNATEPGGSLSQNGGGTGWNYGTSVTDLSFPGVNATDSSATGSNGGTTLSIPSADFVNPATSLGIIAVGDPVSDANSDVQSGTFITAYYQGSGSTNGTITLNKTLTGNVSSGDAITITLLWFLQAGYNNHQSTGICANTGFDGCGQYVLHPGCDWDDIPDVPVASGTLDLKSIENWFETAAAPQPVGVAPNASWGNVQDDCPNTSGLRRYFTATPMHVQDPTVAQVVNNSGPCATTSACSMWAPYGYFVTNSFVTNIGTGWEVTATDGNQYPFNLSDFTVAAS